MTKKTDLQDSFAHVKLISAERIIAGDNPLPPLREDDMANLVASIEECGIENPLVLGPADAEGNRDLIDGFHRYQVASDLGIKFLPYIELKAADVPAYVVRKALAQRNLAKSAKALIVFNHCRLTGELNDSSLRGLAERYVVAKTSLCDISAAFVELCPDGEETAKWAKFCDIILENGVLPARALAGAQGAIESDGKGKADANYSVLLLSGLKTLNNVFANYTKVEWGNPLFADQYSQLMADALEACPQALVEDVSEGILNWSETDLRILKRGIDRKLKDNK